MMKRIIILLSIPLLMNGQRTPRIVGGKVHFNSSGVVCEYSSAYYNVYTKAYLSRLDSLQSLESCQEYEKVFDTLITSGLINRLDYLRLYANTSKNNAKKNLISPLYNAYEIDGEVYFQRNCGFSDYSNQGMLGSEFNLLRSNVRYGNKYAQNDASMGAWYLDRYYDSVPIMGMDGITSRAFISGWSDSNMVALNGPIASNDTLHQYGLIGINRTSSSYIQSFVNGDTLRRIANTSNGRANYKMTSIGSNFGGAYTPRNIWGRLSVEFLGGGLTYSQQRSLYNCLNAYIDYKEAKNTTQTSESDDWILVKNIDKDIIPTSQNNVPYLHIDDQNKNFKFAYKTDTVMFSWDGGLTYPNRCYYDSAEYIESSKIFDNGNVLFFTAYGNNIYASYDSCKTVVKKYMLDTNRLDTMQLHVPSNVLYAGSYFIDYFGWSQYLPDSTEIYVWGNLGNVSPYGWAPANIYCTTDNGNTLYVTYHFGNDTNYVDNGTANSSRSNGDGIEGGDLNNDSIFTRHLHGIIYNPIKSNNDTAVFTAYTGDDYEGESMWLDGYYDITLDEWTWIRDESVIWNNWRVSKVAGNGLIFYSVDSILSVSDKYGHGGIYKLKYSEIQDSTTYDELYVSFNRNTLYSFIWDDNIMFFGYPDLRTRPYEYSKDYGKTFNELELQNWFDTYGDSFIFGMSQKDSNGYYLFNEGLPYYSANRPTWLLKFKQ